MSAYLDGLPSYVKVTGGVYDMFHIVMSVMDRRHASSMEAVGRNGMLGIYMQLGPLDAPDILNAGGMTTTPINGNPIPQFFKRETYESQ